MSTTRFYKIWKGIKTRCYNKNYREFKYYGGRGIKMCDRWHKFENFRDDMLVSYKDTLSIDRIDFNGDYTLDNCRWATPSEQCLNKRMFKLTREKVSEIRKKHNEGEYGVGKELAKEYKVSSATISEIVNKKRNYGYY